MTCKKKQVCSSIDMFNFVTDFKGEGRGGEWGSYSSCNRGKSISMQNSRDYLCINKIHDFLLVLMNK